MCVAVGNASAVQDSLVLEGIVLEGDSPVDTASVILHRVGPGGTGEVGEVTVGPGGAFEFLLPAVPVADSESDVYFASVEYDGVLYFGRAITTLEQLDSLYVVQVFRAQEAPLEGVSLPPPSGSRRNGRGG